MENRVAFSYNSLQLSLRQRIKKLEFLAGYTYSKSLDNGSGYGEQINLVNLHQNILPTRERAHVILEKAPDHLMRRVRLRWV